METLEVLYTLAGISKHTLRNAAQRLAGLTSWFYSQRQSRDLRTLNRLCHDAFQTPHDASAEGLCATLETIRESLRFLAQLLPPLLHVLVIKCE